MKLFKNLLSLTIGFLMVLSQNVSVFAFGGASEPENPISFEDQIIEILSNSEECYRRDIIDKALSGGVEPKVLFAYLSLEEQQYVMKNQHNTYSDISPYFPLFHLNVPSIKQQDDTWCGATTIQIILEYLNGTSPTQQSIVSSITNNPSIDAVTSYLNKRISDDSLKYTYKSINVSTDFRSEITARLSSAFKKKKPMILQVANVNGYGKWPYKTGGHYCLCDGRTIETYTICDPYYYRDYIPGLVGEEGHFTIGWDTMEDGIKNWANNGAKVGYTSY